MAYDPSDREPPCSDCPKVVRTGHGDESLLTGEEGVGAEKVAPETWQLTILAATGSAINTLH